MTLITRSRGRNRSFGAFTPSSLFLGGIQGAWYDPSDNATMFQDAAGTTPVTAVEQPVGSILDKRATAYSSAFAGAQWINTPDNPAFILGSGNFTVEAWVYSTVNGVSQAICAHSDVSASSTDYSFVLIKNASNQFEAIIGASAVPYIATSTATIPTNTWTHVAAVRNGGTFTVYVNGVASGSVNVTGVTANNSNGSLTVGRWGDYAASAYWNGSISNVRLVVGTAVYTSNFTPPTAPLAPIAGTVLLTCGVQWAGNPALTNQGATVSGLNPFTPTLSGNHAYQSTAASRPVLRARYNLLTYSEQFDNAAWILSQLSVSANSQTAPDGTVSGDTLVESAAAAWHGIYKLMTLSGTYSFSIYVKGKDVSRWAYYKFYVNTNDWIAVVVNPFTGVVTQSSSGTLSNFSAVTTTSTPAPNGWFRIVTTFTRAVASAVYIAPGPVDSATPSLDTNGNLSYTGDGISGFYVWGAQLLTATDATATGNAYQRVGASTDYATGGVFRPYLAFDGVDDRLQTASVNIASDAVSLFAGHSIQTAGGWGSVVASGVVGSGGAFLMISDTTGAAAYQNVRSDGTLASQVNSSTFAYPYLDVWTMQAKISTDTLIARRNGAQTATSSSDQGTGTYASNVMYVGSYNGANWHYPGRIYGLIVRGAASSDVEVSQAEAWVNAKTGAY